MKVVFAPTYNGATVGGTKNDAQGRVVNISAGYQFSMAGTDEGALFTWGSNERGQQGVGTKNMGAGYGQIQYQVQPQLVRLDPDADKDDLPSDGYLDYNGAAKAHSFSAGGDFAVIIMDDGKVFAMGNNAKGQLGDNGKTKGQSVGDVIRTGDDVKEELKLNRVFVYTGEDDGEGNITYTLTGRYAQQLGVYNEQAPSDALALVETQLPDDLTITDMQYVVVYKEGIFRYYNVGFNVFERDRNIPYTARPEYQYTTDPAKDPIDQTFLQALSLIHI